MIAPVIRNAARPSARPRNRLALMLLAAALLEGCAARPTRQFSYDASVPPLPPVAAVLRDMAPRPLLVPPAWRPAHGGIAASSATGRVESANAAARVEPRREGYFNAIQVYPWSEGALYQVYAAPGQITTIALEPGETLSDPGPIAAGDTARWIIGDTTSGTGDSRRVHVLVKPSRPGISTNLVIATDRRTYLIELRSGEKPYMPSVAWSYPSSPASRRSDSAASPVIPAAAARNYRYGLAGDAPPWRPVAVYDDGRRVYVEFPRGIVQGEMPPLFVSGPDGEAEIVNTRIHRNVLIVDRLFGEAELRLGSGERQQVVRIVRNGKRGAI
jgi:P-type conjugative transfer protein TrbG